MKIMIILVKFLTYDKNTDTGEKIPRDEQVWHLVVDVGGTDGSFCEGQVFRNIDTNVEYKTKIYRRPSDITCENCYQKIQGIKNIKGEFK